MTENEIAKVVLDAAFKVHTGVGPGLLESVYETLLANELMKAEIEVRRQVALPVVFDGQKLDQGFRADLVVGGKVIVEVKSVEALNPVAYKILLTYLRFADMKLGLLINFHEMSLRDGIKRVVNNL